MHRMFEGLLPQHPVIPLPRDPAGLAHLDEFLAAHAHTLAAIIVEPLVQGAGGMVLHDAGVLRHLRRAADVHGLTLIFDEIFTGFGRTGSLFAFQRAGVRPDIITLSKALTGGTLPLAATIASETLFGAFLSDDPQLALMHGPTYMANAMGCAAANASLDLFESEPRLAQAAAIESQLAAELAPCREMPGVTDVRVMGAIGVVELDALPDAAALGARLVERGVWLRPIPQHRISHTRSHHRLGSPEHPHRRRQRGPMPLKVGARRADYVKGGGARFGRRWIRCDAVGISDDDIRRRTTLPLIVES